jgi:hypothetical protein
MMPALTPDETEREAHLRMLAERLQFRMEGAGGRYTLTRTADLSRPEREENLTLDQVEHLLDTWKLRGLGGG